MFNPMMKPLFGMEPPDEGPPRGGPTWGYGGEGYEDAGMVQQSDSYYFFVAFHCVLVIFSLVVNGTMHATLITMRKKLFESTFYCVVAGLMIFTTLKTVIQAAFVVPQYMKGDDPFPAGYRKAIFTLDMLADYGILGFSTLMAANRHSTFSLGCKCPIFVKPVIYYLIGFVSVIIIVCVALLSGMGCTKMYSIQTNAYVDMCPTVGVTVVIEKVLMYLYYVVCLVSASFYVRTYWLIRYQRGYLMNNEKSRCGPEMVILKQAIIIFGLYILWIGLSTALPFLCKEASACLFFYLTYSLNIVALFIAAAFPGLFLASSNEFRREILSWLSFCGLRPHWLTRAKRITSATTITSRDRVVSISKASTSSY
ncbi:hypothetical protein PRIPAC_70209 [Pristionchus pacificus]|uniref:Uncharacterized protein n=1 Tax=Pristionchus pacificus TaxID=54126 RepID=A0A2A6CG17_PRIPA|nr:hypothetical protein PRIPAC_70209 [Pristionchus pacificus]|eukprot:PDM77154.1 hypothetical protein PRIPAC_43066 [Pristionchus pacificus]